MCFSHRARNRVILKEVIGRLFSVFGCYQSTYCSLFFSSSHWCSLVEMWQSWFDISEARFNELSDDDPVKESLALRMLDLHERSVHDFHSMHFFSFYVSPPVFDVVIVITMLVIVDLFVPSFRLFNDIRGFLAVILAPFIDSFFQMLCYIFYLLSWVDAHNSWVMNLIFRLFRRSALDLLFEILWTGCRRSVSYSRPLWTCVSNMRIRFPVSRPFLEAISRCCFVIQVFSFLFFFLYSLFMLTSRHLRN